MPKKMLWNNPMIKEIIMKMISVICIPKTNSSRNLDMQIGLQLKNSFCLMAFHPSGVI